MKLIVKHLINNYLFVYYLICHECIHLLPNSAKQLTALDPSMPQGCLCFAGSLIQKEIYSVVKCCFLPFVQTTDKHDVIHDFSCFVGSPLLVLEFLV